MRTRIKYCQISSKILQRGGGRHGKDSKKTRFLISIFFHLPFFSSSNWKHVEENSIVRYTGYSLKDKKKKRKEKKRKKERISVSIFIFCSLRVRVKYRQISSKIFLRDGKDFVSKGTLFFASHLPPTLTLSRSFELETHRRKFHRSLYRIFTDQRIKKKGKERKESTRISVSKRAVTFTRPFLLIT